MPGCAWKYWVVAMTDTTTPWRFFQHPLVKLRESSISRDYWLGVAVGGGTTLCRLGLITHEQYKRIYRLIENAYEYAGKPFPMTGSKATSDALETSHG